MADANEFVIKNGVLKSYRGPGGDVVIPEGVTEIGENAFRDCEKLARVELPQALEDWEPSAFDGCENLEQLRFTGENAQFEIVDNVLFRRAPRELLFYPAGKKDVSYAIPAGTEAVARLAFQVNEHLKELRIPASVQTLGDRAFANEEEKNRPFRWNNPKMLFTAIHVEEGVGKKRKGANLFAFANHGALVYPELPLSLIRERNTRLRLALGYATAPEQYHAPYRDEYDAFARSNADAMTSYVRNYESGDKDLLAAIARLEAGRGDTSFADIPYKKLSQVAKVAALEKAVLTGTAGDVQTVLEKGKPFELTARALAYACLYGGADKVRVLLEHGVKFSYKNAPQAKYGLYHSTSANCFHADFSLAPVYKGQRTVPYMLCVDLGEIHFADTVFPDQPTLPGSMRVPIVEMLLQRGCVNAPELLYYALVWDCMPVADALLGWGVRLTPDKISLLSDRSYYSVLDRCELQATLADYDAATLTRVIGRIADLLEPEGKSSA